MNYISIIRRFLLSLLLVVAVAIAGAGCTRQARMHRALAQADRDFKAGNYDRAEVEYLTALRLSRTNPVAWAQLGIIYQAQGQMTKAYYHLQRALQLQPDNLRAQLKLARLYVESGGSNQGREALLKVLAKDPENGEAQLLLVQAASTQDEVRQVLQTLQQLRQQQQLGGGASYYLALGTAYLRLRELDQAEAELEHALELDKNSSEVHLGLASLALERNSVTNAEIALKKAVELAPPRSGVQLKYANLLIKLRPTPQRPTPQLEAKQLVEEVARKTPDYVPAWLFLAEMARDQHNFDEAEAALNRVLGLDPFDKPPKILAGDLAMDRQDFPKAIDRYREILDTVTNPAVQFPAIQLKLAQAYYRNRDIGTATILLRDLTVTNKYLENLQAALLLARVNLGQGHWEQARTNTTGAIADLKNIYDRRLKPDDNKLASEIILELLYQAHSFLALAYLGEGNPDKAVNVYHEMMGTNSPLSKNSDLVALAALDLGRVYTKLNRLKDARTAFELVYKMKPLVGLGELVALDLRQENYTNALALVSKELQARTNDVQLSAAFYRALGQIHFAHAEGILKKRNGSRSKTQDALTMVQVPETEPEINAAEQAFKKAIELDRQLQPAYYDLARLYGTTKKHQEALNQLAGVTNDPYAFLLRGMIHDQVKQYSNARDDYLGLLKVAVTNSPEMLTLRAGAMNNLAYLYSEHLNELDRAYEMATKARDLIPNNPLAADTLGWIVYYRGDYKRALALISECADKKPQEPEVQLHLGLTHYMLGDETEAREALTIATQSSQEFPHKNEATNRLAVLAINPETADNKAIEFLEKEHKDAPGDPVVAVRLARIYARDNNPENAIKICEDSLQRNPQNVQLMYEAARLYARENKTDKALDLAKNAHGNAPDDGQVSHLLGQLSFQKGDYKFSAIYLEESAAKLPQDLDVLYDLALARYSIGKVPEALEAMGKVVQAGNAFPKAKDAKQFTNFVQAATGANVSAFENQAQKLLKADSGYVPALMVVALAQEQRGNKTNAVTYYEAIHARFPLFAPATRKLAILYFDLRDEVKAFELAKKARESFKDDLDLDKIAGIEAYKNGEFPRAIDLLSKCAERPKRDPIVLFYLGLAHSKLRHPKPATEFLQAALDTHGLGAENEEKARNILKDINKVIN